MVAANQRWKVTAQEGVVVRTSKELASEELTELLPQGAILSELELHGEELHYRRISSEGPQTGWVSTRSPSNAQLVERVTAGARKASGPTPAQPPRQPAVAKAAEEDLILQMSNGGRWIVAAEEGLAVRKGQRPTSQKLPERLPLGVVVEEVEVVGERLHFLNMTGLGPACGWVSLAEKGRELMQRLAQLSDPLTSFEGMRRGFLSDAKVDLYPKGSPEGELGEKLEPPLEGWAALSTLYGRDVPEAARPLPGAAAAAETAARRRKFPREDLPPVEDLENLDEAALMDMLGFDAATAKEFAGLSRTQKRKMIAEAKALLEMGAEKRLEALENYKKAWPQGPFPEFTPAVEDKGVLPPGSCFPYSRHLRDVPASLAPEWGLEAPAGKGVRTFFRRKTKSSPEAQKEFLRSVRCEVSSSTGALSAPPGVVVPDPCRMGDLVDKDQLANTIVSKSAAKPEDVCRYFTSELHKRICVLDGCMAARIEQETLSETDYRGERFKNFKEVDAKGEVILLKGNYELLVLTKAGLITDIHKEFLQAGADIVRTNTFRCNALAQKDYKTNKLVFEINKSAAQLAKKAAADVTKQEPNRPRFVAGVIGPTPCMMSLTPGVAWAEMVEAYDEQIKGLVEGGADILMLDGITDALNAKAALYSVEEFFERTKRKKVPVIITCDVESGGRTPSGQTAEAFCVSVKHGKPLAVGVASSGGMGQLQDHYQPLSALHLGWCCATASAGGDSPEQFAKGALQLAQKSLLNFVGGGKGALPSHITALAKEMKGMTGRSLPDIKPSTLCLQVSGLEAKSADTCQIVGSQCTVMGSQRFKKKIGAYKATRKERHLVEAMDVCVEQVEKGADVLDFNLDSDVASGPACPAKETMVTFLKLAAANSKVSQLPFMLCSCHWDTIKEGLKCVQGKCIVNGLTLALGEAEFLRIAKECQRLGAALVVLATTDDSDPAESQSEKVKICQQAYKLLRTRLDFPPEDIIFDCHVLLLGLPEYSARAASFIGAVAELKRTCPGASFVAGVNNLSLPFRGLNMLRDALHSVFLYHAIQKGVNLAIAWPGALPTHTEIEAETRNLCEEMVLNKSDDGKHLERFNAFVKFRSNSIACLPLQHVGPARVTEDEQGNWVRVPAVQKEAKENQKALVAKRGKSSATQQKSFLKSIRCQISCTASPVCADAGAGMVDVCRIEGGVNKDGLANTIVARGTARRDDVVKYLNMELKRRVVVVAVPPLENTCSESDYREYFSANCDICGTSTLQTSAYDTSKAAAQAAKAAAADITKKESSKPRLVAGVISPTGLSLASSPSTTWDEVVTMYSDQVRGLVEGGADLLALESVTDTLNAKAAIFAIDAYFEQTRKERLPLLITAFIGTDGKMPCGQTIDAFCISVKHAKPLSIGLCGSVGGLKAASKTLSDLSLSWCHVSATVGSGDSADVVATSLQAFASDKLVNFASACASPAQLKSLASKVSSATPRSLPSIPSSPALQLSGLQPYTVKETFQMVGQRCNMGGSKKFKGYVDAYKYAKEGSSWDSARELCETQCKAGADILDFNFDSDLTDSQAAMGKFMRLCASDAKVATAPFVLSSMKWSVLEEGLQSVQGKCIVNAISMAEGEEAFLHMAKACQRYGAAVVVMTVDTPGEFPAFSEKVKIGQKAYKLLRSKLDFPAEDIIFDCNVLPITSQECPKDFLDAVAELKRSCPLVSFIGGVSNISLPYRGAPPLRNALNSMLLYHAIPVGLNLAIVDAGVLPKYDEIESATKTVCEDAVLSDPVDSSALEKLDAYSEYLTGAAVEEDIPTALEQTYDLPLAIAPRRRATAGFTQPIHTLVQGTGTINASVFQTFGSKCHTAHLLHKNMAALDVKRSVWFSSISAWMGQGGSGPVTGASATMDGISLYERWQCLGNVGVSVEWGAIGEIGLRRTVYGSRDVFAQFDLGQKLIGPADTQKLMRAVCVGKPDPYEVVGMAYLDQTWQMTLAGQSTGSAIERKNFSDM